MAADTTADAYIDYETFLAPNFDPCTFANSLVLATNDPNDAPLDLSTPLSRVLFDQQEIDSHIDLLTARAAVPLLAHTQAQTDASGRVLADLAPQVAALQDSYRRLEREVLQKHADADEVRRVALRLWDTLRLGRSVGRCLQLGRQLEVQHGEVSHGGGDHRALVRCAHTMVALRALLQQTGPSEEGYGLDRVEAVRRMQTTVVQPIARAVQEGAVRIVREFSLGGGLTFAQAEEAKARTVSAVTVLYLLRTNDENPLLDALEAYLRAALQSSIGALTRSLAALSSLERTLAEVSSRCQNVVALEVLLSGVQVPATADSVSSGASSTAPNTSLLPPLLARLEIGSLASYFWRTLAGGLSPRVQDLVSRSGTAARQLRANRASVSEALRACVLRGVQSAEARKTGSSGWDREVAVIVGSVVGALR